MLLFSISLNSSLILNEQKRVNNKEISWFPKVITITELWSKKQVCASAYIKCWSRNSHEYYTQKIVRAVSTRLKNE